ncbi:MAG: hypothetical protein F4092_02535 [Rhodospirillaceae bacterium]|nr:hypothetical protein [Rhodospirillaceae bacterium]
MVNAGRANGRNFAAGQKPRKKALGRNCKTETGLRGKPLTDAHHRFARHLADLTFIVQNCI